MCRVHHNLDLYGTSWAGTWGRLGDNKGALTSVDVLAVVLCTGDGGIPGALEGDKGHAL